MSINEFSKKASELLEKTTPEAIINLMSAGLISGIKTVSKSFFICISILTVGTVFSAIGTSFSSSEDIFSFISSSLITLSVFSPVAACFEKAGEYIEAICAFMISFIPTGAILQSASGTPLSSALLASSGPIWVTGLQTVSVLIVLPMAKASFSLVTVNQFCKKTNLTSLYDLLKSWSLWILGMSFTIFTGIMTIQNFLQGAADTLTLKGLKYSAARLIPIAGGLVSESMKSVIASIGYIKSISGISGIVFIIYTLVPPLIFILVTKFSLSLLSAFSGATNQNTARTYLTNASGILNILLALLISLCLAFIILLAVFIKSTPNF